MELLGFYSLTSLWSLPLVLVLPVALWILNGFSILQISRKLGMDGGWMAFVPVANCYLMGRVAMEDTRRRDPSSTGTNWSSLVLWLHLVLGFVSLAATVIISVLAVFTVNSGTDGETLSLVAGSFGIVLLWVLAYFLIFSLLTAIGVVMCIVLYKVYHAMAGRHAVWMLLLSLFVGLASTVILLVLAYSKKFPQKGGKVEPSPVSLQTATLEKGQDLSEKEGISEKKS